MMMNHMMQAMQGPWAALMQGPFDQGISPMPMTNTVQPPVPGQRNPLGRMPEDPASFPIEGREAAARMIGHMMPGWFGAPSGFATTPRDLTDAPARR